MSGITRYYAGGSIIVDPAAEDHAAQQSRVDRYLDVMGAEFDAVDGALMLGDSFHAAGDAAARLALARMDDDGLRVDRVTLAPIVPYVPIKRRFSLDQPAVVNNATA